MAFTSHHVLNELSVHSKHETKCFHLKGDKKLKTENVPTSAGRQYAEAYELQYLRKDLYNALQLYKDIIDSYPDSKEAEYSKSQINNIIQNIVPRGVFYSAQLTLAMTYAQQGDALDINSV